jgi:putative addiction module component (TIGR02574 family)
MSQAELILEIRELPVAQRLELVEQIWDTICENEEQFDLSDAQKAELDRRLAMQSALPDKGASWPDVKARLLGE